MALECRSSPPPLVLLPPLKTRAGLPRPANFHSAVHCCGERGIRQHEEERGHAREVLIPARPIRTVEPDDAGSCVTSGGSERAKAQTVLVGSKEKAHEPCNPA